MSHMSHAKLACYLHNSYSVDLSEGGNCRRERYKCHHRWRQLITTMMVGGRDPVSRLAFNTLALVLLISPWVHIPCCIFFGSGRRNYLEVTSFWKDHGGIVWDSISAKPLADLLITHGMSPLITSILKWVVTCMTGKGLGAMESSTVRHFLTNLLYMTRLNTIASPRRDPWR